MDNLTALILVDIQNDYFPGGKMALEGIDAAGVNAARLLSRFREKRRPVFHIRHLAVQPNATFFLQRYTRLRNPLIGGAHAR